LLHRGSAALLTTVAIVPPTTPPTGPADIKPIEVAKLTKKAFILYLLDYAVSALISKNTISFIQIFICFFLIL
jgi:hypothetical protein